ncbi:MAG: hypothetical protein ACJ76L_02805 [Conexibacter sp.]
MSATPEGGAPAPDTDSPANDGEGKRLSIGAVIGIALAVLVVAGIGGYLIGHDKGESSGNSKGYAEGVAAGKQQVLANYQPGKPGYQEIYDAGAQAGKAKGEQQGHAQGKKVGFDQGHKQGVTTGQDQGVKQGAAAVLGGFNSWTEGAFYVITMQAGTSDGIPYTIDTRTQLQSGTNYRICQQGGATQLCESPATADASSTGGGTANAGDDGGAP